MVEKKIIVSTIGAYFPENRLEMQDIGHERTHKTMVFEAKLANGYWEADVSKEIAFSCKWSLNDRSELSDMRANKMHEAVVNEIKNKLIKGQL